MTTYTYRIPLPPKGTGLNARGHWSQRAKAVREYRNEVVAHLLGHQRPSQPLERARVVVEGRICRKRPGRGAAGADVLAYSIRYRPTDRDNFTGACKGALDALQPERFDLGPKRTTHHPGAGVIVGDDERRVSVEYLPLVEVATFAEEGVWITVTEDEG